MWAEVIYMPPTLNLPKQLLDYYRRLRMVYRSGNMLFSRLHPYEQDAFYLPCQLLQVIWVVLK